MMFLDLALKATVLLALGSALAWMMRHTSARRRSWPRATEISFRCGIGYLRSVSRSRSIFVRTSWARQLGTRHVRHGTSIRQARVSSPLSAAGQASITRGNSPHTNRSNDRDESAQQMFLVSSAVAHQELAEGHGEPFRQ